MDFVQLLQNHAKLFKKINVNGFYYFRKMGGFFPISAKSMYYITFIKINTSIKFFKKHWFKDKCCKHFQFDTNLLPDPQKTKLLKRANVIH